MTCPTCGSTTWAGFDGYVLCENAHRLTNAEFNAGVAEAQAKADGTWQEPTYTAAQWAAMTQVQVTPVSAPEVFIPAQPVIDQIGVNADTAPELAHPDVLDIPAPMDAAPPVPPAEPDTDQG